MNHYRDKRLARKLPATSFTHLQARQFFRFSISTKSGNLSPDLNFCDIFVSSTKIYFLLLMCPLFFSSFSRIKTTGNKNIAIYAVMSKITTRMMCATNDMFAFKNVLNDGFHCLLEVKNQ